MFSNYLFPRHAMDKLSYLEVRQTRALVRIVGDLIGQMDIRRIGGLLNEVAILLFLGMTIYSISKGRE